MTTTTKLLLENFIRLQSELVEDRRNESWAVVRQLYNLQLDLLLIQVKSERDKSKHRPYIEFMVTTEPFSEEDRNNIKEISAVNKQIGAHLGALRKLK